jgi:hypothetical protein
MRDRHTIISSKWCTGDNLLLRTDIWFYDRDIIIVCSLLFVQDGVDIYVHRIYTVLCMRRWDAGQQAVEITASTADVSLEVGSEQD